MTAWETLLDVLISLIPPAAVGVIFWIMMRSILRADKGERDVYAKIEAEEQAKRANALGEQR
ncbi:MAG: hypothetical protein HQ484_04160 [Candidatus Aquiluna sp.]|nr:hypothetical protein [Aquiluna sp.]